MSFTKGPWIKDGHNIQTVNGQWIARANAVGRGERMNDVRMANARLVAAAPDLYGALMVTRGQWIHSVNAEQCLAALAKVENT